MYDTKCFLLATDFLEDHPHLKSFQNTAKLAQEIQTLIENWIEDANNEHWTQGRKNYND